MVTPIEIRDESIRLGQLLKLAGLVESGADAKDLLGQAEVAVNGEVETRRARRVVDGDVVGCRGEWVRVVQAGAP